VEEGSFSVNRTNQVHFSD